MKNREQIKEILEMNISDEEKKNKIANIKNHKTDVARTIVVDEELNIRKGQAWDNLGVATSWTDRNIEIDTTGFKPETDGEIEYILFVDGEVEGYQVQYLGYDKLFEELYHEKDMGEDEADELAYELSNDEVYVELMELLGSDGDMDNEAEILVPAETEFRIKEINDGREDVGYIEVILKEVK